MPVNSPCAPAAGCRLTSANPLISLRNSCKRPHQRQVALDAFRVLQRMRQRQARQARRLLVDLGVVLHRARAERIQPLVHRIVELRKPHIVTHHVHLR